MRIKKFNESKEKFPNTRKVDIDGFSIEYGRDAKSNDYLTFQIADENDLWFHVSGYPGSHLVIRVKDNLPTETVIKKVALLAKKNSKAKDMENVKVVYCKRKFVSKKPGMNDGQVSVDIKNSNFILV